MFEAAPGSHTYNDSYADDISEVDALAGAKGYSVTGGPKRNSHQVHWDTPSENTLDGESFPLEARFIHQLNDDALHRTYHCLAVIGCLYELGSDAECNECFDKFWGSPNTRAQTSTRTPGGQTSSLTTPSCTEDVP